MALELRRAAAERHAPRDPDTQRFCNLGAGTRASVVEFLRWRFRLEQGDDHQSRPRLSRVPTVEPEPGVHAARPAPGVTWIGHATMLLHLDGLTVLTDPIWSSLPGRARLTAPAMALEALPPLDAVLVTHNHMDHLDKATIKALPPDVPVIVPSGVGKWMRQRRRERVFEVDWWDAVESSRGRVTFVPAQHWSRRGLADENRSLWGGFVIETDKHTVFYTGDTGWSDEYGAVVDEVARRFNPEAALIPIGAYAPRWFMRKQHIDPGEALDIFERSGARTLLPVHWGTFRLSDEPPGEPPAWIADQAEQRGLVSQLSVWPIGGTTWLY